MKTAIIRAAWFTPLAMGRWGLPIVLWGEPGIAKTSLVEELAAECGFTECETLSPSERGEGAFGVVPVPDGNGVLTYPRPQWTTRFDKTGRGIVFVDEITTAAPAIQAPIMGLVHARRIGGHTLQGGVRVMGAANPPELAAGGFDLAAALANRFGHLRWSTPSSEEHARYMLRGSTGQGEQVESVIDPADEEARVMKLWPEAWARAVGIETSFLNRRSSLKNMCPPVGDPKAGRSWPSDRTWEMATRAMASASVQNLSETETEEFVAAFIGEGPASELFVFAREQDLPDPAALLDGTDSFKHNSKRLDRTLAVLNACAALVAPSQAAKRLQRAANMWGMLEQLCESKADLDILIPSVHALIEANLHAMKESTKTLAKVQPVLKAAGVRPQSGRTR